MKEQRHQDEEGALTTKEHTTMPKGSGGYEGELDGDDNGVSTAKEPATTYDKGARRRWSLEVCKGALDDRRQSSTRSTTIKFDDDDRECSSQRETASALELDDEGVEGRDLDDRRRRQR